MLSLISSFLIRSSEQSLPPWSKKWNNYFVTNDTGIQATIKMIHDHQNPTTCKNKTFVIVPSWNWGHGSTFHTYCYWLAVIMPHNRIMLYDTTWVWADKNIVM